MSWKSRRVLKDMHTPRKMKGFFTWIPKDDDKESKHPAFCSISKMY